MTKWFGDVPSTTRLVGHKVKMTTKEPVRTRPYPLPYALWEDLKADIQDILDRSVIRESTSPYCLLVVVVKKKDGTNMVCID